MFRSYESDRIFNIRCWIQYLTSSWFQYFWVPLPLVWSQTLFLLCDESHLLERIDMGRFAEVLVKLSTPSSLHLKLLCLPLGNFNILEYIIVTFLDLNRSKQNHQSFRILLFSFKILCLPLQKFQYPKLNHREFSWLNRSRQNHQSFRILLFSFKMLCLPLQKFQYPKLNHRDFSWLE